MKHIFAPRGAGPCVKQTVTATVVALDGEQYVGTNHCSTPQDVCPRGVLPTGVGYDLCKSVCHQPSHAEVNALALAGRNAVGSTLYIEGHTYACEPCLSAARLAGVASIVIGSPPQ